MFTWKYPPDDYLQYIYLNSSDLWHVVAVYNVCLYSFVNAYLIKFNYRNIFYILFVYAKRRKKQEYMKLSLRGSFP